MKVGKTFSILGIIGLVVYTPIFLISLNYSSQYCMGPPRDLVIVTQASLFGLIVSLIYIILPIWRLV